MDLAADGAADTYRKLSHAHLRLHMNGPLEALDEHYSSQVWAGQEQVEAGLEGSGARDPVILAETKGTAQVHGRAEAVK